MVCGSHETVDLLVCGLLCTAFSLLHPQAFFLWFVLCISPDDLVWRRYGKVAHAFNYYIYYGSFESRGSPCLLPVSKALCHHDVLKEKTEPCPTASMP